jgi:hypothetical protein
MIRKKVDIVSIVAALAESKRPIFHSEKDFQLHLGWEMKSRGCEVCLEYDPDCFDRNAAIDILVVKPEKVAVELKYKTRRFSGEITGHRFDLKNHSAEDVSGYDFWKDVWRLETVVQSSKASIGYAIFLTNSPRYWRLAREGTADADFRMNEGRAVSGRLAWSAAAGQGTTKGREDPIVLSGRYGLHWADYHNVPQANGLFRYLLVAVGG